MDRNRFYQACLWACVIGASSAATARAQTELPKIKVPLTAIVEGGRFVGIKATNLDKIRPLPGDKVNVKLVDASDFKAEYWSRHYTWEKKQGSKRKVITPMQLDAEVTWEATWGAGITGVLRLGTKESLDRKESRKKDSLIIDRVGVKADFDIVDSDTVAALEFKVQPDPDRVVDRPAEVPPNAENLKVTPPESEPPNVVALVADGESLGHLLVTITRPSSTK